ncbi:MAG: hypothetical protein QNJ32_22345 [Xenococcaceae cyanobacterium MO_167.B27]|nr:hypothetical protein [Xenococcaceae cyanobacterium MO_167.B27]
MIITNSNYAFTFIILAIAGFLSGLIIRRQINPLDLIAVLKTRE